MDFIGSSTWGVPGLILPQLRYAAKGRTVSAANRGNAIQLGLWESLMDFLSNALRSLRVLDKDW